MLFRALVVSLMLTGSVSAQEPVDDWKQIEQGYVRVSMPGAAARSTILVDGTPAEKFVWKDSKVTLELYVAYGFFSGRDIDKTLDAHATYGISAPVSKKPFTGSDLTNGRELRYRAANKSETVKRMFVFEGALHVMTATFPGAADSAVVDKFFGSLKWAPWPGSSGWMSWETVDCQCWYGMPSAGEKSSAKSASGKTQNMWILNRDKGDRFVMMVSFDSAKDAPADAMVEAASNAAMRGKRGERKTIKIGAHPGREMIVAADGVKTWTRMYVANGHMYAAAYSAPEATADPVARDYFFQMFRPVAKR